MSSHLHPSQQTCTDTTLEVETIHPEPSSGRGQGHQVSPEDVYLTWEDLRVTVSKGQKGRKAILQGLTGYALPGEILAIMGPSGCGKSTLLDALAGRLGSNIRQIGDILINGQKQALAYGTSAYVTQDDALLATLTVGEAVYYSAQLQMPESMSKSEKKETAEMTIREMGLQDAVNTRVGGWGAKGLSGGQKRRLSICIEILTRPKLIFLDEPTSGLDSAASYYVMNSISKLDQKDGIRRTIIASIHQPSSEVFQLFNTLCLLSSGKTVYFGPASAANEFFASNGFPCPLLQNPSDHFLKTINRDFENDFGQGSGNAMTTEEVIATLVRSFKSSGNYQQVQTQVAEVLKLDCGAGAVQKERSRASFLTHCLVLTSRSFINMHRDKGYYWLRLVIYIAVAIGLATVFYEKESNQNEIEARSSLLMFVSTFLTFMAIGGFPSFVEDMKVFQRERLNGHYGVTAFAIANTVSAIPFLLLISLIPGALVYCFSGLQKGCENFLYFVLTLFACMMLVESLMMTIASIIPNFLMGIISGAGIQGLLILAGGFFRLPNDLPVLFWKYPMYYIAFHKYAYQGLFKNEFEGRTFPGNLTGDQILREKFQVEMGYSKWIDLAILLVMVIVYRLLFLGIIKARENFEPRIIARRSAPHKQTTQTMENPKETPLHVEIV
uniref:ABC transporter domain-containing protein n=2 Tax=Rhizophora mucronata TaxID=61149 RepID=A0A2P2IQY5_RHIMU